MTIEIDLGNVWEMLSAVGTISAVVISLFFTFRKPKYKNVRITGKVYATLGDGYLQATVDNDGNKTLKIIESGLYVYPKRRNFKKPRRVENFHTKHYLRNVGRWEPTAYIEEFEDTISRENEEIRNSMLIYPYENVGYVSGWTVEAIEEHLSRDYPDANVNYKIYITFDDGYEIVSDFFRIKNSKIINE